MTVADEVASIVGTEHVLVGAAARPYLSDATEARGLAGRADAVRLGLAGQDCQLTAPPPTRSHGRPL